MPNLTKLSSPRHDRGVKISIKINSYRAQNSNRLVNIHSDAEMPIPMQICDYKSPKILQVEVTRWPNGGRGRVSFPLKKELQLRIAHFSPFVTTRARVWVNFQVLELHAMVVRRLVSCLSASTASVGFGPNRSQHANVIKPSRRIGHFVSADTKGAN